MKNVKLLIIIALTITSSGCAGFRSFFAVSQPVARQVPIQNPFETYNPGATGNRDNIVLRTKKGDRSVEVELPGGTAAMTDFVVPMSPAFSDAGRSIASDDDSMDEKYREKTPSIADREIVGTMPQTLMGNEGTRREVEAGLGLIPADDMTPTADKSYLASMDHIKQLYKKNRYEAALLETDELLRIYPTDPKLYEMRGTLFERTGRSDLALRSWNQALRLDPQNQTLKQFVERKQQKRSLASP